MKRYDKLIFVSSDDTALGPMAEALLKSKYLLGDLKVTSKGVVVLFPEPINPKAEIVLSDLGLTMENHMSDPLERSDFDERTLILAVNEAIHQKILKEFELEGNLVRVLNEYVGEAGGVSDPYGGSLEDYAKSCAQIDQLISKLVIRLNEDELLY